MLSLHIPPRLLRALLARGIVIWILARLMAMAVMALAKAAGGEAAGTMVPVWTLVMLPGLMLVDLRRRKELALLHNLGVTTPGAVIVGIIPALVLETGLLMLVK